MAYGNMFPYSYQPQYYQQSSNSIIWVQGEAGAKSYLVAPNTTVQLWDSESQVIYLKSADASGMPSMKILDYTIRDMQQPVQAVISDSQYVTKAELAEFEKRINERIEGGVKGEQSDI